MPTGQRKRINVSLLIPFLVIAMVFGALIWKKYQATRVSAPTPQVQQPSGSRSAVLFFVADGSRLAREAREMEPCEGPEACLKSVLDELVNGPVGELEEALPDGSVLKSVRIAGDTAMVDLNQTFADGLPSGSSAEMMAVYSIVDTVCINFPEIARVKLSIEGVEQAGLRHLDLSEPLTPDYSLEREAVPETGTAAKPSSTPDRKKGHK